MKGQRMSINHAIWEWYHKHDHAIQTLLEIACELIPGAKIIQNGLKGAYALYKDQRENTNQAQIEDMQEFLVDIQPNIQNLTAKISQHPEFQKASNFKEQSQSIQKNFATQLPSVLASLAPAINKSVTKISQKGKSPSILPSNEQQISERKVSKYLLNQRYEMLELLGTGGQGEVYKALDITSDHIVAIKLLASILSQDVIFISELRSEYTNMVDALVHPNIVQYRNLEQDVVNKQYFIVMDYIAGINLRQWMFKNITRNPLSYQQAIKFLFPIAEALDFAHQKKICHCDLKPENILIRESDQQLFLADFGLAKEIRSTLSRKSVVNTDNINGTLPYMSPEQYLGRRPDGSTDIWGLGVILYELVAGYHPFNGTSFEHYMKLICDVTPESIPDLTQSQSQSIFQMLHKDRSQRPTSAKAALLSQQSEKIVPLNPMPSDPKTLLDAIQKNRSKKNFKESLPSSIEISHETESKKGRNGCAITIAVLSLIVAIIAGIICFDAYHQRYITNENEEYNIFGFRKSDYHPRWEVRGWTQDAKSACVFAVVSFIVFLITLSLSKERKR